MLLPPVHNEDPKQKSDDPSLTFPYDDAAGAGKTGDACEDPQEMVELREAAG